jgi:uncharacterized protein
LNLSIFGATGRVGSVITENALQHEHTVHALVRNPKKLPSPNPSLKVFEGNVLNQNDIAKVMTGTNAVFCALNTGGDSTLSEAITLIVKQMKILGIQRIITIGTAGILQARTNPYIYRFQSSESKRTSTKAAKEHLMAYIILKNSGLDWTIVCPTYLPAGERIGTYCFEKDFLPENSSSISVYDTGDFAFAQLESRQFVGARVGISY